VRHRFAVAIGAAVVAVPWGFAFQKLLTPRPVASSDAPSAIVWGDRVFSGQRALKGWLTARGVSYHNWVREHPAALAVVLHETFHPRAGESTSSSGPSTAPVAPVAVSSGGLSIVAALKLGLEVLLLGTALVLLGVSFAPEYLLNRAPPRLSFVLQRNRAYVAVGAIAIFLGYAVQALA
jgi:hypothetical protein